MALYHKGQIVDFQRADIVLNGVPIIAVVPVAIGFDGNPISDIQWYILEYTDGFVPDLSRINQYELDGTKKYMFVKEDELTLP